MDRIRLREHQQRGEVRAGGRQQLARPAHVTVDGAFGSQTYSGIKSFQQWWNHTGYSPHLSVDGVVGPRTGADAGLRRRGLLPLRPQHRLNRDPVPSRPLRAGAARCPFGGVVLA
ncbi:peptidoglycan-binding protein [Streptomyces sp. T1317-0309]|nr:peptidoglycan-binding protein [Streptomyces sp. T1317-0309]